MIESTIELPLFETAPDDTNVQWFIGFLKGRDWITSATILREIGRENTEGNRRWLRMMAEASGGRIAGGQAGYRLVTEMTKDEWDHFYAWMTAQAAKMEKRAVQSAKVFYQYHSKLHFNQTISPPAPK